MKARPATVGDLEFVFRDLSKRMSEEYVAAGKDKQIAYDNLMMNLWEGRAHALLADDRHVAIIAWHEMGGHVETLFAAQDDFFNAATVRFCKRHIRQIQALAGNLPIRSRSWLDHPDVTRWFGIIDYAEIGREDGAQLYELAATRG